MSRRSKPTVSPYPQVFKPTNLEREIANERQIRNDEETVIWGPDDAFPLRIIRAVDESPTTISCLEEVKRFMQGAEFSDEGLMALPIDKDGTTLWDFHSQLCEYLSLLDGFTVNFKYNPERKITNAYVIGIENCRFKKPSGKQIHQIKYNPYFGTSDFKVDQTSTYDVFDLNTVMKGLKEEGNDYKGQIYFYGSERPLYKFYPVPKYWSGSKWIYVDGQIQEFHKNNLDNGFFQSVLLNVIGDPSQASKNPEYQKTKTNADGTIVPDGSTKTVGEEFNDKMAAQFSGVKKAGSVMAMWARNKDESPQIQAFPTNTQFDVLQGTFTDAIRGITIATGVPAILANLPQQASSLGSDGNSIKAAIELMQARVAPKQRLLENFYNKILLPNFHIKTKELVTIKNYSPVSSQVVVEDKYWEFMDDQEKAEFINENVPNIKVKDRAEIVAVADAPKEGETNEVMKSLNLKQLDRIGKIKARLQTGKVTLDEATMVLKGYGFTDAEVQTFLQLNGEEV